MIGFVRGQSLCASTFVSFWSLEIVTEGASFFFFRRYSINALSFSHDGEYLAIANAGTYIDIVCYLSLHPTLSF